MSISYEVPEVLAPFASVSSVCWLCSVHCSKQAASVNAAAEKFRSNIGAIDFMFLTHVLAYS